MRTKRKLFAIIISALKAFAESSLPAPMSKMRCKLHTQTVLLRYFYANTCKRVVIAATINYILRFTTIQQIVMNFNTNFFVSVVIIFDKFILAGEIHFHMRTQCTY